MAIRFVKNEEEMIEKNRFGCLIISKNKQITGECERSPETGNLQILPFGGNIEEIPPYSTLTLQMDDANKSEYRGMRDEDGNFNPLGRDR